MSDHGWIGVDLDGTLAKYDGWKGIEHIGEPILPIVNLVKQWLAEGKEVRIYTARVAGEPTEAARAAEIIQNYTEQHVGRRLAVTNVKDFGMIFCVDDRAKQVIPNAGVLLEDLLKQMEILG